MLSIKIIDQNRSFDVLKLWTSRILFYFILFLLTLGLSHYILMQLGPSSYSMASARYMISALIQSEAAIMAIIVTLSLVAVELAASSYSVRMIDLLKVYNPDFWILIMIYILSMIYSIFVLMSISDKSSSKIELMISFAYHTGVYSFLILFPYLFRTLQMLKPSTLLNMQAMKISTPNIMKAISSDVHTAHEKDPIQPIIDIVSSALLNHDFETIRNGLNIIGMRSKEIFLYKEIDETEMKMISYYIFSRLARFAKFTLNHNDEDATFIVIKNLEVLWDELKNKDPRESVLQASSSLEEIGKVSADMSEINVLSAVINHLYDIGQWSLDYNYDGETSRIIDSLSSVCLSCIEKRMDPWIIENIIISCIGKLGVKASYSGKFLSIQQTIESMNDLNLSMEIGESSQYQHLCGKTEKIIEYISKD